MRIRGKGLFPYIFLDVPIIIIPGSHYLQLFSENLLYKHSRMSKSLENNLKLVKGILQNSSCQDLIKIMRKIRNASLPAPACLRLTARNISRKLSHQKLVLTLRRPRYSYYKQVLVSPYMQSMLSPRGCPLEKKGYEVHVLSQEHSGDVCNNCHKWQ